MDRSFHDRGGVRLSSDDQALLILILGTLVWRHFEHLVLRRHAAVQGLLRNGGGSRGVCQAGVHHLILLV